MLRHKASHQISKAFSTSSTGSFSWRTQIKQNQLAYQISSILLQRHNWVSFLQTLNLSPKLTHPLFLQILHRTQTHPQICLGFFNWAKSNLGFEADLKSHCHIIQILLGSGLSGSVKPLFDNLVRTYPASVLVDSINRSSKGRDSQSNSLSFVLESYSKKGMFREGLEVYAKMRFQGCSPSVSACNALLEAILREGEIGLAWCFYGAMIRNGFLPNRFTWSLIAQAFFSSNKLERITRIVEMGIHSSVIHKLLIDGYSQSGNFGAAFDRLNKTSDRKLGTSFGTHVSILDGACKHEDSEAVEKIMNIMVEKELLSKSPLFEYDSLLVKLCDLGKTYAAEMFFRKACHENNGLRDTTYGRMLKALSEEGKIDKAIWIYSLISEKGIKVNDSSYNAFASVLIKEDQHEEGRELLMYIMRRGFSPCASQLSAFIGLLCRKGNWREAEEMLSLILESEKFPDSFCCCSLVEHYCSTGQIDKAMTLHDKMEKLDVSLDVETYNVLLNGLFFERRMEEALRVFGYMRRHKMLSSRSFTIMIGGLCGTNELRKAMKIHDEMLKMGLKPDKATYKRLISAFK
ncbi:hypothetical protein FEM48_Zijuj01G0131000 [Ziziphus jujuba var. spinosa]|uniref:Pentatricopeptide repeat-containing protein At4g21170 n=1 Tax=Ziziphus jujuba var. spinosa TaxID=714518 RepID=A0A978W1F5_ZIZJJ|nr:hypothetical protein FEM48_Zijuj01G0131000 [Ziziphus jujuba var. spinosa]